MRIDPRHLRPDSAPLSVTRRLAGRLPILRGGLPLHGTTIGGLARTVSRNALFSSCLVSFSTLVLLGSIALPRFSAARASFDERVDTNSEKIGEVDTASREVKPGEVKILVATRAISPGQPIVADAFRYEIVPANVVPDTVITDPKMLVDKIAAGLIPAGFPLSIDALHDLEAAAAASLAEPMASEGAEQFAAAGSEDSTLEQRAQLAPSHGYILVKDEGVRYEFAADGSVTALAPGNAAAAAAFSFDSKSVPDSFAVGDAADGTSGISPDVLDAQ